MGSNGVLRGIVTAMVTPLDDSGELDLQGTERLLEHLISGGVHGIFVLGTTGEAPALTHRQREELVRFVCNRVDGRLPVLVGVTDTSFEEAVALSQAAAKAGAYAIVTAPPFYYQLSQDDLLRHLCPVFVTRRRRSQSRKPQNGDRRR